MQKDKKKRLWKVVKELLKDPLLTTREIEEKTWISKSTVANYINNDLDTVGLKDERILNITNKDFELMNLIQEEKFRRLQEDKENINNSDINRWEETATKRYTLFRWNATDDKGWLKSLSDLSDLELMNMINGDK